MSPKLTSEQRAALVAHEPGRPVQVVDEESNRVFWLISPDDMPALWAAHVKHELQRGLEAIDRGELVSWDPEAMKQRARRAAQTQADGE